jgi:hypothetical protein
MGFMAEVLVLAATLAGTAASHASVTISSAATLNMSCVSGVCTPTARDAVLNVNDLTTMLASGNVQVNTGSGSLAAHVRDIRISAGFSWASANSLTLSAFESVTFDKAVSVAGPAPVSLVTNNGGTSGSLSFGPQGSLSFLGTTNTLSIEGQTYTLANTVASLAADIASNPSGFYALSASYDASPDGIYGVSPILTQFGGTLAGLGNTISHLTISDHAPNTSVGLFEQIGETGSVDYLRLSKVSISFGLQSNAGGVAGQSAGTLLGDSVTGNIKYKKTSGAGGIVGSNDGIVTMCHADVKITGGEYGSVGGLVGATGVGTITASWATGTLFGDAGSQVGGLVGFTSRMTVSNSYSTSTAAGGQGAYVGGLIGQTGDPEGDGATTATSYSTGAPTGGSGSDVGGLIGVDDTSPGSVTDTYWDTTTSGITNLSQGAGNIANDPGIAGETSAQLQAGLPAGFDPTIWAESPSINNGFPYLIANPPPN